MPDIDELRELVRPNTRRICINNASNPVGAVLDAKMLEQDVYKRQTPPRCSPTS